jgi:hypothetical protein
MGRAFRATRYDLFFVQLINVSSHSAQRASSRRSPSPSQGLLAFSSVVAPHLAPSHAASCARAAPPSSAAPPSTSPVMEWKAGDACACTWRGLCLHLRLCPHPSHAIDKKGSATPPQFLTREVVVTGNAVFQAFFEHITILCFKWFSCFRYMF